MIHVIATLKVKPEQREAFMEAAQQVIAETNKEKGCLFYECHGSIRDPATFVFVERWETRDDLNAHGRSPHMKAWRTASEPFRDGPSQVEIITDGKVERFG